MIMTNPPQTEISPISSTLFGWRYKIQRFKSVWAFDQTILFHCFLELLPELIFWKCCFEPKFVGSESWNVEIKLPLMFLSLAAYSQKKEITFLHKMLLLCKRCGENSKPKLNCKNECIVRKQKFKAFQWNSFENLSLEIAKWKWKFRIKWTLNPFGVKLFNEA